MKPRHLVCLLLLPVASTAWPRTFTVHGDIPPTALNDDTRFGLLNAPLGTRFSLNFSFKDNGVYTGALGFDADDMHEFLVEIETETGRQRTPYRLRTAKLTPDSRYLLNQKLDFGLTCARLSGEHPDGLDISLTVVNPYTPSESLDDEAALRVQIAPCFYLLLDVKNRGKKTQKGVIRLALDEVAEKRRGGENDSRILYEDIAGPETRRALVDVDGKSRRLRGDGYQGLSLDFELGGGESLSGVYLYAAYHSGTVLYDEKFNMPLRFYYTALWPDLDAVIRWAVENMEDNLSRAERFENLLKRSSCSPEEKWVVALAFHTDLANTFLLVDSKNRPRFYFTEGRFSHLNTIDVAHETELSAVFCPWRLKLQLDQWLDYIARERILVKGNEEGLSASEFGPYLFHDVGNFPGVWEATGYSYGPHMAVEENSCYALLLYWYWKLTGDDRFTRDKLGMVEVLLHSLVNRDLDGSGLADAGMGWSTYDVSEAIRQSSENVYLGVKQMCAYLAAADMFEKLAVEENLKLRQRQALLYTAEAEIIAGSLESAQNELGYIPTSLNRDLEGWDQLTIVLGEGLLYPKLAGLESPVLERITPLLASTFEQALERSKTSYGIRLSSQESVTWFSKVMVMDLVASMCYGTNISSASYTYAWNKNNAFAYNDGAFDAQTAWAGNWYPRGISSLGYLLRERNFRATERERFLDGLK